MALINCKVELKLKWTKYCAWSDNDNGHCTKNEVFH